MTVYSLALDHGLSQMKTNQNSLIWEQNVGGFSFFERWWTLEDECTCGLLPGYEADFIDFALSFWLDDNWQHHSMYVLWRI